MLSWLMHMTSPQAAFQLSMSRLSNAFLVPTAVCIGINIQRIISGLELFVAFRSKWRSSFYILNAIALVGNILGVLLGLVQVDFINSPFPASSGFSFLLNLCAGVFNTPTALILLYVLISRLYVFYKVSTTHLVGHHDFQGLFRSMGPRGVGQICEFLLHNAGN
jgi:membrane protein YqaA with SNARE-associated domain